MDQDQELASLEINLNAVYHEAENRLAIIASHYQSVPEARAIDTERAAFFLNGLNAIGGEDTLGQHLVARLESKWLEWTNQPLQLNLNRLLVTAVTGEEYHSGPIMPASGEASSS